MEKAEVKHALKQQSYLYSPVRHRHTLAARRVSPLCQTLLDLGGYRNRAEYFEDYCDAVYSSVNVGNAWYENVRADYIYDGVHLPFNDKQFDCVVSVDSIEHVKNVNRYQVLSEMNRVAKRQFIVVSPFMADVVTDESLILDLCKKHDIIPPPSLVEHEELGLPNSKEFKEYANDFGGTLSYCTDRRVYWAYQTAMIINTITFGRSADNLNRKLRDVMEVNFKSSDAVEMEKAYRIVLVVDKEA